MNGLANEIECAPYHKAQNHTKPFTNHSGKNSSLQETIIITLKQKVNQVASAQKHLCQFMHHHTFIPALHSLSQTRAALCSLSCCWPLHIKQGNDSFLALIPLRPIHQIPCTAKKQYCTSTCHPHISTNNLASALSPLKAC